MSLLFNFRLSDGHSARCIRSVAIPHFRAPCFWLCSTRTAGTTGTVCAALLLCRALGLSGADACRCLWTTMADDNTQKPGLGRRKSSLNTLRDLSQRLKHVGRKTSERVEEEREIIGGKHVPAGAVLAIACSFKCRVLCFRVRHRATTFIAHLHIQMVRFRSPLN